MRYWHIHVQCSTVQCSFNRIKRKKWRKLVSIYLLPYRGKKVEEIFTEITDEIILSFESLIHFERSHRKNAYLTWDLRGLKQFLYFIFRVHIDLIFDVFNFTSTTRQHRLGYKEGSLQKYTNQIEFSSGFCVTLRNNKFILHATWQSEWRKR